MNSVVTTATCPVCLSPEIRHGFLYSAYPAFLSPMDSALVHNVVRRDLHIMICSQCGHLFQPEDKVDHHLLNIIYRDYYLDYRAEKSEAMNEVYRRPFWDFFRFVCQALNIGLGHELLEIGCSSPANMAPMAEMGFSCLGVDPSPLALENSCGPSVEMISGYYEETDLPRQVDVIVARLNLEHIADLDRFMNKMCRDLKPDGLFFVQVPNVEYGINIKHPLFAAHEHIHYYSLNSLVQLMARFGFGPVCCFSRDQPSLLGCFARNSGIVRLVAANMATVFDAYRADLEVRGTQVRRYLAERDKVVLYGAGPMAHWVLSLKSDVGPGQVCVVDDDPNLQGTCLPGYGVDVLPSTPEVMGAASGIILTLNFHYHNVVLQKLRLLNLKCDVVLLRPEGVVIKKIGESNWG